MDRNDIVQNLNEVYMKESFAWQPGSLFIHKMTQSNDIVEERLGTLAVRGILKDVKDVWMISFVHPDAEFCVSFVCGSVPKKGKTPVFFALADPNKLMLNKRITMSGISLEKISEPVLKTTMFLSSGRSTTWKKIYEIDCHTISTTAPIPLGPAVFIWENFRSKCEPNKLGLSFVQMKKAKFWTIPQIFTKSNYLFQYNMIIK